MATGVGGPIGAAMIGGALLSAGASAGDPEGHDRQRRLHARSPSRASSAALAGGAGAYVGADARARDRSSPAAARRASPAAPRASPAARVNRGIHGGNPFDPAGMGDDLLARRRDRRRRRRLGAQQARDVRTAA